MCSLVKILTPFIFIFKYTYYGFLYMSYMIFKTFKLIFKAFYIMLFLTKYIFEGFIAICYSLNRFFRYTILGALSPFLIIYNKSQIAKNKKKPVVNKQEVKLSSEEISRINKQRLEESRRKQREKDEYRNENVIIKKKKLSDYINSFFVLLSTIPKKIKEYFKNKFHNNSFIKNKRNQKDVEYQALMIDFNGADAEKTATKLVYEYVAKSPEGKVVKGYFEAYSKVEVHSFLLSEGFEVYSIKTDKKIQFFHKNSGKSEVKFKTKDLIFLLTQLSTYIKAGIPLVESLRILLHQFKNKKYQRCFRSIIYDLSMGENFSTALAKQGESFPRLLINMVKASELTGQLPEALDDMEEYFTEVDKTRKQMISAITYPAIVFVVSIVVIIFIMVYVVPQFVEIYQSMDGSQVPAFTLFIISVSEFLKSNLIWIIIGFALFAALMVYLYKNVKMFKTLVQWTLMHIPVIKNVIIYNEVTMFTKTFASLLAHNVYITDSMDILNKVTNNEIYKMLILDTITNLAKGEKISLAFKDHWAFPLPAYEMLVTGEKTGELPEMMAKVSTYYQEMHKNSVTRIKAFVEPILIVFLTFMVGTIVLAIVIPMFSMYEQVQQM